MAKFLVRRLSANFTTLTRNGSAPGIDFAAWRIALRSALNGLRGRGRGHGKRKQRDSEQDGSFMVFSGPARMANSHRGRGIASAPTRLSHKRHQVGAAGEVQEKLRR